MADNTKPLQVDLHAHVLPLLDLCRYAAMASTAFEGLADTAHVLPDFGRRMHHAAPDFCELADYGGGAMVAGGLWVAMDLLRVYADAQESAPEVGAS